MLILTETDVEEGAALSEKLRELVERKRFAIDGNPQLSVTVSIGIAGGSGPADSDGDAVRDADAAMYSAKSLGRNQTYIFEEPDEDARVPRAPISDAGRARAVEIGQGRARRRDGRAHLVHRAAPPLPRPAVGAHRLDRRRDWPPARSCPMPRSTDPRRGAPPRRRQGRRPEEILDKPAPLTSAEWRTVVQHPRIGQVILEQRAALATRCRSSSTTTSASPATAYPYGLRANEIPLGARIVAIADAYDAMTTTDRTSARCRTSRHRPSSAARRDAVRSRARRALL
jgi:hypothetical protein